MSEPRRRWTTQRFPAIAALVVVALVLYCARTYTAHALYFDHSMYQYTGWCIRHGEKLYETVAVPDGPFITWLHAFVQIVFGESDHAFRIGDLVIQSTFAIAIGFTLSPHKRGRGGWTAFIVAAWLAQYFRFDWHWTAQRESYYALVGYLGMAFAFLATKRTRRRADLLALAAGALTGSQLFGKQIGVIFIALAFVPLVLSRRRKRLALFAVGGVALAIVLSLLLLALTGSIEGFLFWYMTVPRPYRFIMGSADPIQLLLSIDRHAAVLAILALVAGTAAMAKRLISRRLFGFAVAPLLFFIAMALQRKGHIYQAHPITAGNSLFFALFALHLARRGGRAAIASVAVVIMLTVDLSHELLNSTWIHPDPPTLASQLGAPHINHGDLVAAASKVAEVTKPDDRVFAYGPSGRLMYEAKRRPAAAPYTNFFFNLKRAVIIPLTPEQQANVDDVQRAIAARSCPQLATPPAALVVCDRADWSGGPGLSDAAEVCPAELGIVKPPRYEEVGTYGCWRIYARRDAASAP